VPRRQATTREPPVRYVLEHDDSKRTLLQVQLDDALKAEEMFRALMGEKVEARRELIQKHALEVKEIDYHGA